MDFEDIKDIQRLNFEDFLWVIFIILGFINIYGDNSEKEYIKTKDKNYQSLSNKLFTFTIEVTLIIYIYFFIRNYNAYKKSSEEQQNLYLVKLLGSAFLIAGAICLAYFQINQKSFIGAPAI